VATARGDIESIDTRVPPDDMHAVNFKDVVGKKPVALIMATPQLCESRVCGPVVDIAQQLKAKYGDRMEFIHQEVFVDNRAEGRLRPPLRAFRLRTEPWPFTVDRDGKVDRGRADRRLARAALRRRPHGHRRGRHRPRARRDPARRPAGDRHLHGSGRGRPSADRSSRRSGP